MSEPTQEELEWMSRAGKLAYRIAIIFDIPLRMLGVIAIEGTVTYPIEDEARLLSAETGVSEKE
ncbi:MAG TPA: hypothetical protein VJ761_05350 [Ktedonobacteraceae bacterium]|nr:hypothetical protein [Ktedonobacteraceae bacterium]